MIGTYNKIVKKKYYFYGTFIGKKSYVKNIFIKKNYINTLKGID